MPIVEAMASDVPVVASNASSLPEVVGDAGVIVNQTRAEAIAEGVLSITSDPAQRVRFVSLGRERLKLFSWERAASATVAVLEQAVHDAH